jgi:predicted transposase YbfD/YdcC
LCQQVVDAGGDYLFIVKGNRQALDNDIALIFAKPPVGAHFDSTRRVEKQKGRIEKRELTATDALNGYIDWPGVAKVCQIRRVTESKGRRVEEVRYAITSLSGNAEELLALVRGHWAIENRLHRVRDVTLAKTRVRCAKVRPRKCWRGSGTRS